MSFDEIFDLTAGVYFNFHNMMSAFYWEVSYFLSTMMVSIGIYTLGGEF